MKWGTYGEEHPVEVSEAHHCSGRTCGHFRGQSLGLLHGYKAARTDVKWLSFTLKLGCNLILTWTFPEFVICLVIWTDTDNDAPFILFVSFIFLLLMTDILFYLDLIFFSLNKMLPDFQRSQMCCEVFFAWNHFPQFSAPAAYIRLNRTNTRLKIAAVNGPINEYKRRYYRFAADRYLTNGEKGGGGDWFMHELK